MKMKARNMAKSRLSSAIIPISAALIIVAIVGTGLTFIRRSESEEPITVVLADTIGDADYYFDITEVTMMKKNGNLILGMTAKENIPKRVPFDADIQWLFLFDTDMDENVIDIDTIVENTIIKDFIVRIYLSRGGMSTGVYVPENIQVENIVLDNIVRTRWWQGYKGFEISYVHIGPTVEIQIPLTKVGDLKWFNFKAFNEHTAWKHIAPPGVIYALDTVPDNGWAMIQIE